MSPSNISPVTGGNLWPGIFQGNRFTASLRSTTSAAAATAKSVAFGGVSPDTASSAFHSRLGVENSSSLTVKI